MTTSLHPGLDLPAFRDFCDESGITVVGELRARLIAGGKSNLTYLVADDWSQWVLRRPPTGGLTPSAHDVAREQRVMAALRGSGVPVAATVALCEDPAVLGAPFSLVAYVPGTTVQTKDDLSTLSDDEIATVTGELVDILARLHDVDHRAVGLGEFGRPEGYLGRQVDLWAKQWTRVQTSGSADVDRLHSGLAEAVPVESDASIVHGDYRIDNAILRRDYTVAAVVDWEMSTIGDPLSDAALMCVYRNPALDLVIGEPAAWTSERLPSPSRLAQQYAEASDRDLAHWGFYMALANFKVAVIAQGINHRYEAGATVGEGFDRAGDAVPEFVAAGLRALKGSF
jgi:aminoglycoside phosphotransferase (APT) family kinase protein